MTMETKMVPLTPKQARQVSREKRMRAALDFLVVREVRQSVMIRLAFTADIPRESVRLTGGPAALQNVTVATHRPRETACSHPVCKDEPECQHPNIGGA